MPWLGMYIPSDDSAIHMYIQYELRYELLEDTTDQFVTTATMMLGLDDSFVVTVHKNGNAGLNDAETNRRAAQNQLLLPT